MWAGIPASKPMVEGSLAVAIKQIEDVIPMTVIRTNERVSSQRALGETVKEYMIFSRQKLVSYKNDLPSLQRNTSSKIKQAPPISYAQGPVNTTLKIDILPGPYFVSVRTDNIYKAFRSYPEHQLAFTEAAVGDGRGGLGHLPVITEGFNGKKRRRTIEAILYTDK
ncbi:uncharacterized protein EURHEDRAFT_520725 [Aspergillus ruber CBS 135680]|uniref:Uncharacterized protein n=1 Tax=Aspergillus ruber (strain CBS 135680) TaxID=1388766 RepID=A0A017SNX9_ASPRC|nr:uncharacterized protein EURHEDRAFT_520725 [Aspergillus ruber CBS 135680]EYE98647.1 hypothetical protein EURHEDRAFT_520725 [Aspergillus ruber CBS 135680]